MNPIEKNDFKLLKELLVECSTLNEQQSPYLFLGNKIKSLFPHSTVIINSYHSSKDLFKTEYIHTPIEEINKYLISLKGSLPSIVFSLSIEQKQLATSGKLEELKKEDFLSANYLFNKDLLNNLLVNIPLHSIYVIGLVSNTRLLGNVTFLVHEYESNFQIIEPLISFASLLIEKALIQQELKNSLSFFQSVIDNINEFIIILNEQYKIKFANQSFVKFLSELGFNSSVVQEDIYNCCSFLNHKFFQALDEAKQTNKPVIIETSTIINEQTIHCQTLITPIIENHQKQFIVSVRNLNSLLASKKEISLLNKINQVIIDNLSEAILIIDENFKIITCNQKFFELFPYEKEQIFGKNFIDLMPQQVSQQAKMKVVDIFTNGMEFVHEISFTKNGQQFVYFIENKPILDNGKTKFLISIIRDTTEVKNREKILTESKAEAEKKEKIKSNFIATLSHEIRTPLNAINGFVNLLLKPDLTDEKKKQYIAQINQSALTLSRLIDDLLDISAIEAGNIRLKKETIFLFPFFNELYEQFLNELEIRQKKNIRFVLANSPEDDMPFYTDELRLRQILSNLLINALKYTQEGEIRFGFTVMNSCIVFFVKDTGPGLTKEQQEQIFEPFQKFDNTYTQRSMGLGLFIVKNLAEAMGGTIHVDSELNKGSTFSVRFKYESSILVNNQLINKSNPFALELEKDINVLVAEDDDINYMFIEEMLASNSRIHVFRAQNGKEAIEFVKEHLNEIDIILMDIQMPILDGHSATKIIRELHPSVPIIAQTAYAYSSEIEESKRAGCNDYLVKPINQSELFEKISYYVSKH